MKKLHVLTKKLAIATESYTLKRCQYLVDQEIREWLEEKANTFDLGETSLKTHLELHQEPVWCEHLEYRGQYWEYAHGGVIHSMTDTWRLCPICGAKRPE